MHYNRPVQVKKKGSKQVLTPSQRIEEILKNPEVEKSAYLSRVFQEAWEMCLEVEKENSDVQEVDKDPEM